MDAKARPRTTRHDQRQHGFTIVELTIAIVVMAIAMGAVALALGSTLRHGKNSTGRTVASGLVTEELETVRQDARTDFMALPLGMVERVEQVDGVSYRIIRESAFVAESSTEDVCTDTSSGSGATPAFLRVRVLVTWDGATTASAANAETLLSPPVGAFDPSKGHVAVQVRGADAAGTDGVTATLRSGVTVIDTLTTTTDGCAFFAYVTPGTYTVTLSRANHVDGQNEVQPSQTVTVTAATAVATSFDFDQQGTLSGGLVDLTGHDAAFPDQTGTTLAHTSLFPSGVKSVPFSGDGSSTRSITTYPYAEGYQVWAGTCADADPGVDFRPAATTVSPGDTTSGVEIGLTSTRFEVEVPSGSEQPPHFSDGPVEDVKLRLVHAPMTGCDSGETLTYDADGETDSNGRVRLALPLGTWTVEVVGDKPGPGEWAPVGGTWPQITITGDPRIDSRSPMTIEVE